MKKRLVSILAAAAVFVTAACGNTSAQTAETAARETETAVQTAETAVQTTETAVQTTETAAQTAVVMFYSVERDEDGRIRHIDFNFVEREYFDRTYEIIGGR